jgi:uncharacterized coiled-coil protein SlyX
MPEPIAPPIVPGADLLTKLSNRLNDLEAKLEKAESENRKSYVDHPAMEARIVELKSQIASMEQTIKELQVKANPPKPIETPPPLNDPNRSYKDGVNLLDILDD